VLRFGRRSRMIIQDCRLRCPQIPCFGLLRSRAVNARGRRRSEVVVRETGDHVVMGGSDFGDLKSEAPRLDIGTENGVKTLPKGSFTCLPFTRATLHVSFTVTLCFRSLHESNAKLEERL
jgi:hypothetical protein